MNAEETVKEILGLVTERNRLLQELAGDLWWHWFKEFWATLGDHYQVDHFHANYNWQSLT